MMSILCYSIALTVVNSVFGQVTVFAPIPNLRTAVIYPAVSTYIPLKYHCDNINDSVCLEVFLTGVGAVLESTCIPCSQNDHSLNNMGFGAYEITLRLQGSAFTLHQTFEIVSIESGLPEIILPDDIEILAIPPLYNGDVSLQYNLFNPAMNVVKQIEICIQMENVITGLVVLPQSCVRSDHNMIGLKAIVEGDYRITLICRLAFAPFTSYPNSEKTSMVYIRRSSAFLPTYEWKRVHAWESVPAGLEIRLPIGESGGQKMAKIPEPWRLQLAMPAPCKYFLRMDVYKHTTSADILNAAALRCKMAAECFELIVGDIEITPEMLHTTNSSTIGFFNNELVVEVLPVCQSNL